MYHSRFFLKCSFFFWGLFSPSGFEAKLPETAAALVRILDKTKQIKPVLAVSRWHSSWIGSRKTLLKKCSQLFQMGPKKLMSSCKTLPQNISLLEITCPKCDCKERACVRAFNWVCQVYKWIASSYAHAWTRCHNVDSILHSDTIIL